MYLRIRISVLLCAFACVTALSAMTPAELDAAILHGDQSTLKIVLGGKVIYVDPIQIPKDKADYILLTHPHDDHMSALAIKKLGIDAKVIASFKYAKATLLPIGESITVDGITIKAVPAWNASHPKAENWAGFLVTFAGCTVYIAGDTGRIPEMKNMKADIAIVPLGQSYTMASVDDAVAAVIDVGASIAHPYHYGMYEGSDADAESFLAKLKAKGVEASLLKPLIP